MTTAQLNLFPKPTEWAQEQFLKRGSCSCGYSLRAPGVGYFSPLGWICKRCGEFHTLRLIFRRFHKEGDATVPRIIGYTYQADQQCVDCTKKAILYGQLTLPKIIPPPLAPIDFDPSTDYDEHGIPDQGVRDSEDNEIHPIFNTDDIEEPYCGVCLEELE